MSGARNHSLDSPGMHSFSLLKTGTRSLALILIALLIPLAGLLGGCAENRSNLLPGNTVEEISSNLDRVRDLADSGDCLGAIDAAQQVTRQIEGLGTAVDSRLKRSLRDGASRLVLTIQESCQPAGGLTTPAETTLPEVDTTPEEPVAPEDSENPGKAGKTNRENPAGGGSGNEKAGPDRGAPTGGTGGGGTGGTVEPDTGTGGGTGGNTGGSGGTGGTGTGGVGPPGE